MGGLYSRRAFLGVGLTATAGLAASSLSEQAICAETTDTISIGAIKAGSVIVFQGDSITDVGRDRTSTKPNDQAALGNGYAWLTSAQMLADRPNDDLKIYNRGIGGNTVQKLRKRWENDCFQLNPDVLSILIGFNDFNHTRKQKYKGGIKRFTRDYRELLDSTKKQLPDVCIVIGEPFILHAGKIEQSWRAEIRDFQEVTRSLAMEFDAAFIDLQEKFDAASKIALPAYWAPDGIHPSLAGAALMSNWWLQALGHQFLFPCRRAKS